MSAVDAAQATKPPVKKELERDLSLEERELLHELFDALRLIRYGSVLLTVHDGQVVEIQKTERVRKPAVKHT